MELRVLRYFLAVAREESISDAAEFLHITQPTLSRQLMDLEEELGKQLLIRGKRNRKIMLTEDGMRLRKRAEEIVALADKTEAEFLAADDAVSGDVYIGCGESDAMRIIAKTAVKLRQDYPDIHFHLYSGNAEDVSERMEKGLLDFGIFITSANIDKYDYLKLPAYDTWGLIMRKSDQLYAQKRQTCDKGFYYAAGFGRFAADYVAAGAGAGGYKPLGQKADSKFKRGCHL